MVKKILLTILLMITQSLVNSQEQKVPDTNQLRYSQTASDDGIVEATQPEASQLQIGDDQNDDDRDVAQVPENPQGLVGASQVTEFADQDVMRIQQTTSTASVESFANVPQ
ncbi:MAG: hypothetical protein LVQ75_01900 [Candidatus Babeliales bacterium]|jgi:hypothetical protein